MSPAGPINYTGNTPLSALPPGYGATAASASTDIKTRHPSVATAFINGITPQKSRTDQNDTKPVITVDYSTATGDRVLTIEAHDDMTYNGLVA
ncbi:hypothetical protein O1611_g2210 [Lasiodiplodia mahajangana]|uniref:Uncharacterized protein n=1 Tax=Lasiodiplodia mahajangana TaxID=1108764 RepID=A0ACC2JVJ4_9PEZI|nr:hypothetical protein O1611_g2210 [Lasiodiplodia mahajangana]